MTFDPKHVSGTWTRSEFARIARDVETLTGIVFPANRIGSAEAAMVRAMSKLRITSAVSLEMAVAKPGPARDALMMELTIGESYFFREPAQLRFLSETLLPEWNASWAPGKALKVWSAGCAGGQEPYSIAILLREKEWKRPHSIVGTDLSESRLEIARQATFSKWSLRSMQQQRMDRWFKSDGSKYHLNPEVAADVKFGTVNLASSLPDTFKQQDVIFCRNVLIYFDIPTIKGIAERLLAALSPDGWLFLGASDPHIADLTPCEAVVIPGATAYRRCSDTVSAYSVRNSPLTLVEPVTDFVDEMPVAGEWAEEVEQSPYAPAPGAGETPLAQHANDDAPDSAGSRAREVRRLANQGHLVDAGKVLSSALERYPENAELHLLESILHADRGRWSDAERAARRALYLDRSLTLAHVALGDALGRKGDDRGARRNFENAVELIGFAERRGDLADTDGVPLARLLHIVRAHLSALGASSEERSDSSRRVS